MAAAIIPVSGCCGSAAGTVVVWRVVVFGVAAGVVEFVFISAMTGSVGTAKVTVHAATLTVNGVISCQAELFSMNGVMSDEGRLHL